MKGVIAPVVGGLDKFDVVLVQVGSTITFTGTCQQCGTLDIRGSAAGNGLDFVISTHGLDVYQFTGSWIY
jgi:hypothetical protein